MEGHNMTTIGNINAQTQFNYRTKFKKILNESDVKKVDQAFNIFCNINDPAEAIDILWKLTFESAPYYLESQEINLPAQLMITQRNLEITRNELRVQYEQLHPDFLKVDVPDKCKEAFDTLVKQTDTIVAKVVYDNCHTKHLYVNDEEINRILYLLKSDKDTYHFGAIRRLGFDYEEANYLKQYHNEIHDILKFADSSIQNDDLPFYMSGEEESVVTVDKEQEPPRQNEECPELKPVTLQDVIANQEIFKAFVEKDDFNLLIPIAHLKFDLNDVMNKREKIKNLVMALEAFN